MDQLLSDFMHAIFCISFLRFFSDGNCLLTFDSV